jgi:hypothetical protein
MAYSLWFNEIKLYTYTHTHTHRFVRCSMNLYVVNRGGATIFKVREQIISRAKLAKIFFSFVPSLFAF